MDLELVRIGVLGSERRAGGRWRQETEGGDGSLEDRIPGCGRLTTVRDADGSWRWEAREVGKLFGVIIKMLRQKICEFKIV